MGVMEQMASALEQCGRQKTPEERRREWDQTYYRRNKERAQWRWRLKRLESMLQVITGAPHENQ